MENNLNLMEKDFNELIIKMNTNIKKVITFYIIQIIIINFLN